jgi:hypothetical protein
MHDKRKHERFEIPLEIRVTWPEKAEQVGITRDFSDGGAFLLVSFDREPQPDTIMELQMTSQVQGKDAPVLKARVVRTAAEGIAFEFIPPPPEDEC